MLDANDFINNAIATARAWLVTNSPEDVDLFDGNIDADFLPGALNACLDDGPDEVTDLNKVAGLIDTRVECSSESSFVVFDLNRVDGRWKVECVWDNGEATAEDCNILRDSGALDL